MGHPLLADAPGRIELLLGNEAIVRGALEAGVQVVTCYPGTPSSEVPDTFFRLSPEGDFSFEYSTNEKVAFEVAAGATLAGAMTLVTMKHVGLNVAADPLMTLAYLGAPGGLVVLSADDPGCHSSQNEQDNRAYARLAGIPCFEPSTAQEAKDMTRAALLFSREHGLPVMLRTTTRVNHLRGPVTFGPFMPKTKPAGVPKDPRHFVPVPVFARPMHLDLMAKMARARTQVETSPFNKEYGSGPHGVLAVGINRSYLADALAESGLEAEFSVLELGFSFPLPEERLTAFMRGKKSLLVLEELEPILETEVRALAQKAGLSLLIQGKDLACLPRHGEYSGRMVTEALYAALGRTAPTPVHCAGTEGLPVRPPNLCAGCPHRAAYFAVRQVYGDEATYSSDIGCYTLGLLPPLRMADFLVCMGSSVSAGCGASRAAGQKVVAFIGDSTFFHSGMTGLANAVYNRHDILLVILDNKTTAMTGHQPHPGVEKTALGDNPARIDIEAVVKALGVTQFRKVNPLNLKATTKALEELKGMSGVRVLLTEEPCPLFARRVMAVKKPMTAYIPDPCDDCGQCLDTLACPAFSKKDGRVEIDELSCSGCMFCLQVCDRIKARKRSA